MTPFLSVFLIITAAGAVIILLPEHIINLLVRENGPAENAQVAIYAAGAIISLLYAKKKIWLHGLSGGIILTIFALRELDFQKKFTGISITRTKFYFSPDFSLSAKIFCGLIVLGILSVVVFFAIKNIKALLNGFRRHEDWAITTINGLILIPIALVTDSSLRSLKFAGIKTAENIHLFKAVLEETIELAIPVFFLIALFQYGRAVQKSG